MDVRAPSNLDDLGLRHIYDLYTVLAGRMTPTEINESELWELAAVLGVDPGVADVPDLEERLAKEATPEQMARRIAAAKVKPRRSNADPVDMPIDPPEPKPVVEVVDMTETVMRQMGIH